MLIFELVKNNESTKGFIFLYLVSGLHNINQHIKLFAIILIEHINHSPEKLVSSFVGSILGLLVAEWPPFSPSEIADKEEDAG